MYLGIDLHKRYAQVAVIDDAGEVVEEVRVEWEPIWALWSDDCLGVDRSTGSIVEVTNNHG